MKRERSELIAAVAALKGEGRLDEALVAAGELLQAERYDPELYSMAGKIYYLLEDYDAAARYFLSALHLEVLHAEEERKKNESYRIETEALLSGSDSPLLKHLKKNDSLRLLLLFGHTLIHLAHSLADKRIGEEKRGEIDSYRRLLSGEKIETDGDYAKMENDFYFHIGLIFAVSFLRMSLAKESAVSEYFTADSSELGEAYSQSLKLFEKVR